MPRVTRKLILMKFITPAMFIVGLVVFGTLGYMLIEDYPWFDAMYMTIITIGTVGYGEIHPLDVAGKLFTMLLILCSIGLVAYFLTTATRLLLDGEWTRDYRIYKQLNRLRKMENHVIVCGYGRNGRQACDVFRQNGISFTVIESASQDHSPLEGGKTDVVLYGDATKDEVLLEAGIHKAKALISSLPDDADNLFVVLTARQLNPNITIISRASYESSVSKLKIAGANNVIMPDKLGGGHMATLVLIPDVHEFISMLTTQNNEQFRVTELTINHDIQLMDLNLWSETGSTILGIKHLDGKYLRNPPPEYVTKKGERLIMMGNQTQLEAAKKRINAD